MKGLFISSPIIAWFIRPHMFWTVNIVTEWFRSHESSFNGSSAVNYLYSDLHLMGISDDLKVTFHSAIENSPKRQFQHMAPTRPNRLPMLLMVTTNCNNEMPKFTRSTSIITKPFSKSFSYVIISLSNFLNYREKMGFFKIVRWIHKLSQLDTLLTVPSVTKV